MFKTTETETDSPKTSRKTRLTISKSKYRIHELSSLLQEQSDDNVDVIAN